MNWIISNECDWGICESQTFFCYVAFYNCDLWSCTYCSTKRHKVFSSQLWSPTGHLVLNILDCKSFCGNFHFHATWFYLACFSGSLKQSIHWLSLIQGKCTKLSLTAKMTCTICPVYKTSIQSAVGFGVSKVKKGTVSAELDLVGHHRLLLCSCIIKGSHEHKGSLVKRPEKLQQVSNVWKWTSDESWTVVYGMLLPSHVCRQMWNSC